MENVCLGWTGGMEGILPRNLPGWPSSGNEPPQRLPPALSLDGSSHDSWRPHSRLRPKKRVSSSATPSVSLADVCQSPMETYPSVPERVVGQVVAGEVVVDVLVVPVDDRVDLEIAVLQREDVEVLARRGLRSAQADDPAARAELVERSLHRLDLVHAVVALDALESLLPLLAPARLLPGRAELRTVDLDVQAAAAR